MFAAAQGWSVVDEVFEDVGFSVAPLDRPGLQRLLDFVRQGGADRILIHRLDRLSRKVRDCVGLFDEFRRLNLYLVIVTAPELGQAAQDHSLLNIMASFAEFEREVIAGRIADARAELKTEARRIAGAVPFGYHADPRTKQLVANTREAEIIRGCSKMPASESGPLRLPRTRTNCVIAPRRTGGGVRSRWLRPIGSSRPLIFTSPGAYAHDEISQLSERVDYLEYDPRRDEFTIYLLQNPEH